MEETAMIEKQTKERQNEQKWDKLLKIRTTGRDDSRANQYCYPYEPTPYCVLERLAQSGYITRKNKILDYGCGKGRVDFFLSWQTRCRSIGIEYNEWIFQQAKNNQEKAVCGERVALECHNAKNYRVPLDADRIYFFNPFSLEILREVISRILESYYEAPRRILLFFYYPSDEYMSYLITVEELLFLDEIHCMDLFPGNYYRERIVIFELQEDYCGTRADA